MTTSQLLIISLAALAIVMVIARTRLRIRQSELYQDQRRLELDNADKIRRFELERLDAERPSPAVVGPELGATIAVYIDGRIVQGTLDVEDTSDRIVLTDATAFVDGGQPQSLGSGRQYLTAALATQIQEL